MRQVGGDKRAAPAARDDEAFADQPIKRALDGVGPGGELLAQFNARGQALFRCQLAAEDALLQMSNDRGELVAPPRGWMTHGVTLGSAECSHGLF